MEGLRRRGRRRRHWQPRGLLRGTDSPNSTGQVAAPEPLKALSARGAVGTRVVVVLLEHLQELVLLGRGRA